MKKILKLFLIFLYILFIFTGNTCNASYILPYKETNVIQKAEPEHAILLNFDIINDTSIAASNNNGYEISALKNDKENSSWVSYNAILINKFIAKYLKGFFENQLFKNNHNLYLALENEICTRAP